MQVALKIVPANHARRDAVAWFIAGSDPQVWLAELGRWNVPLQSVLLRPVSRAFDDRRPLGVLATLESTLGFNADLRQVAIPFGCVANRLFLPIDAEIIPPIDDAELVSLLPGDHSDLIWHPSAGLVQCDAAERLRVIDLVQPRETTPSRWDRAVPGVIFRSRLLSIEPASRPSAEEILQSAGPGIGSSNIDELPPAPGEGLGGQIYQWTKPLRNAWKSLWKKPDPQPLPLAEPRPNPQSTSGHRGAAGGGWLGLLGLAASPLLAAGAALGRLIPKSIVDQAARLREVDRLLNLLKNDPDAGLKFALPMSGQAAPRGIAPPSNQLVPRDLSFGMGNLLRNQSVDPWSIPAAQQFQLIQMYRELAAREVRMGRHRRAAYIFAELLGDLSGAAGALETGQHYREAAVLYRDKLHRPHDAVRCLERGGLLDEAAELYIELGMMEDAADLYFRLERPDEAERLLRNWAAQLAHQGNHLRASEVLHQKLHDVDSALENLDAGWALHNHNSERCLKQVFTLLGQACRHDVARQRIANLRDGIHPAALITPIARILGTVATDHVDASVRADASNATIIVVSRRLRASDSADAASLLATIRALAPQDRLLTRDCDRFVRQKEAARRDRSQRPRRMSGITFVRSFKLGEDKIEWSNAKSNGDALYAVGFADHGLVLRRLPFSGIGYHDAVWANISRDSQILLELPRVRSEQVLIHVIGNPPLGLRGFQMPAPAKAELAGSPIWATSSTVAFACSDGGTFAWRVRAVFGTLELSGFGAKSEEISNGLLRISIAEDAIARVPVTLCASVKPIRIGVGRLICRPIFNSTEAAEIDADEKKLAEQFVEAEADIESLHNHRDRITDCVVALFDAGGVVIQEPIHESHPLPIADGIQSPKGVFLSDGTFIVAGQKECHAYHFQGSSIRQVGQMSLETPAIAVTRTNHQGQFAIVAADGTVRVHQLNL